MHIYLVPVSCTEVPLIQMDDDDTHHMQNNDDEGKQEKVEGLQMV